MNDVWANKHKEYNQQDWITKPSIFAETAMQYFPKIGKILELGAGQAQDSFYFAARGYTVVSTDLEQSAQEIAKTNTTADIQKNILFNVVDLRDPLPYDAATFEVVYAHLSLHYFDAATTTKLFKEINRVLKPGGVLAFLVNSINDPEYKTGVSLEQDYFKTEKMNKRFFSVTSAGEFTKDFNTVLLDDQGETYKDNAIGVHNLIRYVGTKP